METAPDASDEDLLRQIMSVVDFHEQSRTRQSPVSCAMPHLRGGGVDFFIGVTHLRSIVFIIGNVILMLS